MAWRVFIRTFLFAALALTAGASAAFGQAELGAPIATDNQPKELPKAAEIPPGGGATSSSVLDYSGPSRFRFTDSTTWPAGFLTGTRDFPNFIGFISNPVQSIDPRSSTEIVGMFGSGWVSANDVTLPGGKVLDRSLLPSGNLQVYGGGPMAIALTDRLCFGFNDGGYAVADFNSNRPMILRKLGLPVPAFDLSGQREGWLDIGGYVQYTLIADVPNQFLLTAGLRWEAPAGATQVFQGGANPAYLAPYLTAGKEFGNYHVLATAGYQFPAGSGGSTANTYYLNFHFDRKIGWLYPLVELNGAYVASSTNVNFNTPRHGIIDLGTFDDTTNSLTLAVGFNAVLIPTKLELGAVYIRPIASQGYFDANGLLVKMTYRF
jgi:hypothetical protein